MMKHVTKAAKSSLILGFLVTPALSFLTSQSSSKSSHSFSTTRFPMASDAQTTTTTTSSSLSWDDLVRQMDNTPVGKALTNEVQIRKTGKGSAHVHNTLRMFDSKEDPQVILYRDHAGW